MKPLRKEKVTNMAMSTFTRIVMLCAVCLIFPGTAIPVAVSEELATVDDIVIQDSDFKHMVSLLPFYWRSNVGKKQVDKQKLLDKYINEVLIAREAKKLNVGQRQDYKKRLESLKRELLVDVYLKKLSEDKNTEANQRKYQHDNKEQYTVPEKVRIAVITLQRSEDEAKEILERIKKGEDFAELARAHSVSRSAKKGGDMGFRTRRDLKKGLADVAFSMKKGELKGPIKTKDMGGFHIIKLLDRKEKELIEFDKIRTKISNDYALKLRDDEIARLRKGARINVNGEILESIEIR